MVMKDAAHPVRFVTDLLPCLIEAGITLSPKALRTLARHREGQRRTLDASALEKVMKLTIEMENTGKH